MSPFSSLSSVHVLFPSLVELVAATASVRQGSESRSCFQNPVVLLTSHHYNWSMIEKVLEVMYRFSSRNVFHVVELNKINRSQFLD